MVTGAVKERVEGRSVSMYPRDWELVEKRAQELGLGVSALLRLIVREALDSHPIAGSDGDGCDV